MDVQTLSPARWEKLAPGVANWQPRSCRAPPRFPWGHSPPPSAGAGSSGSSKSRPGSRPTWPLGPCHHRHHLLRWLETARALPGASNLAEQLPGGGSPQARSELPAWLTLAGYAATQLSQGRLHISPDFLYSALAWYSLAWCSLSLLANAYEFDRAGAVIAPAFLATRSLPALASRITPQDTATALFGFFLARDLPIPLWASLPGLVYAIYSGYGAPAAVALFGLGSAWKLTKGLRQGGAPPLQHLAFVALAAWGLYSGQSQLLAVLVFLGQLGASAVS